MLPTSLAVLFAWTALFAAAVGGAPAGAEEPGKQLTTDATRRQQAEAELQRLAKEAGQLEAAGKHVGAIAAGEKALLVSRVLFGNISETEATWHDWLASQHEKREDWPAARKARQKTLAIRAKIYGDKDWHVTNARLAVRDTEIRSRLTAEQHRRLADADQDMSQAAAFDSKREGQKAIPSVVRALEIRQALLGEDHPQTAASCDWLGYLYKSAGQFSKAEPLYRRAVATRVKVLGEKHPDTQAGFWTFADLLVRLANDQIALENFAVAQKARSEALAVEIKIYGETDWRVTDCRLAVRDVEIRARLAPDQRRELAKADQAVSQALTLDRAGNSAQAVALMKETAEIRRRLLGREHPDAAACLSWLGSFYFNSSDYAVAERTFEEALALNRKLVGENHPNTAANINSLASVYQSSGRYGRAEPLYRKALEIDRATMGPTSQNVAADLNNLACLYQRVGDYTKSERLFRQAIDIDRQIYGNEHPYTAFSLNGLASVYFSMGDFAKAEDFSRQALAIKRKTLGEAHPNTATSLAQLAVLYQAKGDLTKAEEMSRQALEIRRKIYGEENRQTAESLQNLAAVYWSMGKYKNAEPLYRQAIEIFKRVLGEDHPDAAIYLSNLALLEWSNKEYTQAELLLRQSLETSQRILNKSLSGFAERQQLTFAAHQQLCLQAYLSVAGPANVRDAVAYGYVLQSKGTVTGRQSLMRVERRSPQLNILFQNLQTISSRLGRLAFTSSDPAHPEVRMREMERLTELKETLEEKLAAQSEDFARIREATRLDPAAQLQKLRASLPRRTALVDVVEYTRFLPAADNKPHFATEQHLAAFVVRAEGEIRRVDLGPVLPIANAIAAWGRTYGVPGTSDPGLALRKLFWQPVEPYLDGIDTILFSPDGPLHAFPLSALPGAKPGTYVLEERNVVIVPVARLLPDLLSNPPPWRPGDDKAQTPLLIGDVDFSPIDRTPAVGPAAVAVVQDDAGLHRSAARGNIGRMAFPRLPGTAVEIQKIGTLFQRIHGATPRRLSGSAATEEEFRREAPKHRWLHVATHGFFAPPTFRSALDPSATAKLQPAGMLFESDEEIHGYHPGLLSGIVLSGANAPTGPTQDRAGISPVDEDDGILTALEVADLELSAVDLVVLSACETGLGGYTAGGEGLMGLQRAFELAGARSCVASLWKVDDAATQMLMSEFYSNLWQKKLGKLEALRQAQLRMLHEYDPQSSKFVSRGLDVPAGNANSATRGSPFYWAAFVLSGDWR